MKNRILTAVALVIVMLFTLSACKVEIDRSVEDPFAGEYTAVDEDTKLAIAERISAVADQTDGKNLQYVSELGLTITTEGGKLYAGGVTLKVIKDPSGETGVTYTYFTFGGYSGKSNYLKEEFFIYSVDEEQTTYFEERATLNRSEEKTVNSVKYKKTEYCFDVYEFLGEKGYDFNFFGGADVTDIRMFAAVLYYDGAEVCSDGVDKIKILYEFSDEQAEQTGYEGCAYYVLLSDSDYSIKVVMTYHGEDGELKETDKTVVISTTSTQIVLPTDLDEYEDGTESAAGGQTEDN